VLDERQTTKGPLVHRLPYGYERDFLDWLFPLLMFALIVGLVMVAIRSFRPRPLVDTDPLRRAAGRYAAGEIERVEFERIQRDLTQPGADPLEDAALRLARGDITTAEFDELRDRIRGAKSDE
jgi:uncharacterized membrane protein